jgi:peroxiredoxin
LAAAWAAAAAPLGAQDPRLDQPCHRLEEWAASAPGGTATAQLLDEGLDLLEAGWPWEARRCFREVAHRDPGAAVGYLGLALAARALPRTAALLAWEAARRRAEAPPAVQRVVDAYARYFGVADERPNAADPRFDSPPSAARQAALAQELARVAQELAPAAAQELAPEAAHSAGDRAEDSRSEHALLAQRLAALESAAIDTKPAAGASPGAAGAAGATGGGTAAGGDLLDPAAAVGALRQANAYAERQAAMPFFVPGYRALLARAAQHPAMASALAAAAPNAAPADRLALALSRLPRHPHFGGEPDGEPADALAARAAAAVATLAARRQPGAAGGAHPEPGGAGEGPLLWQPRRAPGFDLPRGLGGRDSLAAHAGRPVLVVFFLGFGCVHCIAQLRDLDPLGPAFARAGIDVVSIGTDDENQVKAAHQQALENGVDPLHLDVLCDPQGETFARWGAFDEFLGEPLHGTFLVGPDGRILWQDVSAQPFAPTEFLLPECERLLQAWR